MALKPLPGNISIDKTYPKMGPSQNHVLPSRAAARRRCRVRVRRRVAPSRCPASVRAAAAAEVPARVAAADDRHPPVRWRPARGQAVQYSLKRLEDRGVARHFYMDTRG